MFDKVVSKKGEKDLLHSVKMRLCSRLRLRDGDAVMGLMSLL